MASGQAAERELLVAVLTSREVEVVNGWLESQRDLIATGTVPSQKELRDEALTLVEALREGLRTGLAVEDIVLRHEPLRDAVTRLSTRRARGGVPATSIALGMLSLKEAILGVAESETTDTRLLYGVARMVSGLLDAAGALTFATYVEGREEIIRTQHQQMLELSTPVVLLWPRVLAVPLIGTLDSARTQLVMNSVLETIRSTEALVAIIDITGVPTVDTAVAHHLLQTVSAVRLMGAECFISGIRPTIAQTITQLGIDLSTITTRATLADALAEAIRLIDAESPVPDLVRGGSTE
ncbi:STAS domain-containing protein [Amycolatopsis sp. YIM 10]|uniref:STAS domain-containing protein n=1 Tax=Amycolatopsis sp. YIM 10 TaxID=2653857 RepID=UPI0012902EE7|nr:STAS domain-containing protein [Amycolatopsis sp. YIM 10]QFU86633.1 RsbT co-antagonist protein RsbRA [Amycolatopsis sp. YIM 10]